MPTPTPVVPKKKIVFVPKVKKVIIPRKKIVYVPSKKKIIVKRPASTGTVRVPTTSTYVTSSYVPPKPIPAQIPQRTLVQQPVAVPVPVRAPVQNIIPMNAQTLPYSQRTVGTTSYRPSLQLQSNVISTTPYKQGTYRPGLQKNIIKRPSQIRRIQVPMPVRTIAPVAPMPVTIPNVQSYRPAKPLTLPTPVARTPVPIVSKVQTPIVPQVQVPITTSTVRPVQVPVSTPVPVPVARPIPVQTSTIRPVQAPVAGPVPVPVLTSTVKPVQVPIARPPIASVTPVNTAPNLIQAQCQNIIQPMMKPPVYSASTYRPALRRNTPQIMYTGFTGYRPVNAPATNIGEPSGYTTRTYRPRRL